MAAVEDFAHGHLYGDYSGVVFYAPPTGDDWLNSLVVSDRYIDPLFRAVLDRASRERGGGPLPRLVVEWNTSEGWAAWDAGRIRVLPVDAEELGAAIRQITATDLAPHCAGSTPDDCLRCAAAIREFLGSQLARGASIFIEDD